MQPREQAAIPKYNTRMHAALFLDRDGVIIENRPDYVRSWSDVEIYPGALAALASAASTPLRIVIVTNQSAVGRGLMTLQAAEDINTQLVEAVRRAGGRVDGVFMCPHAPEMGCDCRKPQPGLILRAARSLDLDLGRSFLVGDALSDLQAGRAAGVPHLALVLTGRGAAQLAIPDAAALPPFSVFEDLAAAINGLLSLG